LAEGQPSAPIETPLGVFVARSTAVEPGSEPSFEALRAQLAEDHIRRVGTEIAYRTATRVEEVLNEGKPLQEAASAAGVAVVAVDAIDASGRDRAGAPVAVFAAAPEALRAFMEAPIGKESSLIETRAGAYVFVRVDSVVPSQKRPLSSVRDDVVALWSLERRADSARKSAEALLASIRQGKSLDEVAASIGATVGATQELRRDGRADGQAQADAGPVASRLFQLKTGEAGLAAATDGYLVVVLTDILAADPAAAQPAFERLGAGLEQSIATEISQQYLQALRERLKVVIDKGAVDKLYQN
jgi:peptidyl-prolyl cis-trans isomerase D